MKYDHLAGFTHVSSLNGDRDGRFRVLVLGDTHLGFDLPYRPRVERARRGEDFFRNYENTLNACIVYQADMVVHTGDLLYRSRVPASLVDRAMGPLVEIAKRGTPVFLVPGNHERSKIPLRLWTSCPNLHIFHQPGIVTIQRNSISIVVAGFPFLYSIRQRFIEIKKSLTSPSNKADIRLLCMHQAVAGSVVGPSDFVFRNGSDVLSGAHLPIGVHAVLAGHIHRAQVLREDHQRVPLPSPVIYPGSIERTSFAEQDEQKGFAIVDFLPKEDGKYQLDKIAFVPLPTRPMVTLDLREIDWQKEQLAIYLQDKLHTLPSRANVRLRVSENTLASCRELLNAGALRKIAPSGMIINLAIPSSHFRRTKKIRELV